MRDLIEESWAYQEMVQEGLAKGLQQGLEQGWKKGREKGLEEGRKETLRQTLVRLVQKRFPDLVLFAQQQAVASDQKEDLSDAIDGIVDAQTLADARKVLSQLTAQK